MELERIPAASAMDWSIDLDRGLRSRQPATRVRAVDAAGPRLRQLCTCATAPAPVASAYGVLPGEARVFAETMLLRLATEFRTADGAMRVRIVRTLLNTSTGPGVLAGACVAEPDQLLRRVKAVYDTGNKRDRALALRVFGCFADIAKDSVHVRSLILSSLGASSPLEVDLLLLFMDHDSSSVKSVALKCMRFMFRRNTCHFPVIRTVFGRLLPLIDDEDFPLDCKSDVLRILQKMLCSKASSNHHANGSELSKLLLAAESSLDSSLEIQGTALEILVEIFCILKEVKSNNISVLKGSSFAYAEWQGAMNNIPLTEENSMNGPLCKIITMIVNHIISLVNEVASRNTCLSSEVDKACKTPFRLMLKLVSCYPSAAAVALDILKSLAKELFLINGSDYSEVSVTSVEPFQTSVALEELNTSDDNVQLLATSIEASCTETDIGNGKLDFIKFDCKNRKSIMNDLIHCTLKFANACHEVLCETSGAKSNSHESIKGLIKYVHQDAPQHWSTYESFHLVMCACVTRNTCKISGGNNESGDSKEHRNTLFAPSVWLTQELCALRMTKMLIKKQKYWEAYKSSMYCCRKGLWFTASFVFRKLADGFKADSFSFWLKSLLLLSAGEIEMKLLLFPSATVKLVGELKMEGDFSEDLYCTETDADSTLSRSSELHGFRAKISDICGRTLLANNALASSDSSDHDFLFQRWFICLRSSFLEVLTNVLDILSAHSSYEARGDHLTLSGEFIKDQALALDHCSLRLSDLAKSYDLLAASHMDLDRHSSSSISRLAFMCSLLAFCTTYSVYFPKACNYVESCKLPKRFSHASILQDLHGRVDRSDWQVVSQLRQFMPTSFDELDSLLSSTRISGSCNLEKDLYSLYHFAVASLLAVCGSAEAEKIQNGEDCLSALQGGLQVLSSILQKYLEFPFVVPKYFFRVRPCLGAELYMFDSNPVNEKRMSIEPGSLLSLTLCMKWKRVLERSAIRAVRLYCILATSLETCLDAAGTRSKKFDPRRTAEMVELNSKLLQYIKSDLRKAKNETKNSHCGMDMVTAFACFEPTDSGQGFSGCLLDVSSFPEGSYQIKWHACCVDENGSYFSLLPLNDGSIFSIWKS